MDAHVLHSPWRPGYDRAYLPYVGNGYIGLATTGGAATAEQAGSLGGTTEQDEVRALDETLTLVMA